MKLYQVRLGNEIIQGNKYIRSMLIQDEDQKTTGSINISYSVLVNGRIICYIGVRTYKHKIVKGKTPVEIYQGIVKISLDKKIIGRMLIARNEEAAKEIFTEAVKSYLISESMTIFGSFTLMNSVIAYNIPSALMQVI